MVEKLKDFCSRCYLGIIVVFLYAPILVLIVLSFNNSRSRVTWGGFTLDWYKRLLMNSQIMEALGTTLVLAFASAFIATVIGVLAALGINAMRQRNYQIMMAATNIPMLNADIVTGIALMLWFVHFLELGFGSVLLAHITFNIPYVILSVMPKIR
ncbi:ABC transporter permease, partial [Massilistercora timonensis]